MTKNMTKDRTTKQEALLNIAELAKTHELSLNEITAYLTQAALQNEGSSNKKNNNWIIGLLGYLGAAFIVGGLGLFISMIWEDLASPARVIITYGPGLVLFILGVVFLQDRRFAKASTPLFLLSVVFLPTGMFVFLDEYAAGNDTQLAAMLVFGWLACQFLGAFYFLHRTNLLFFGYLFWNTALGILMERSNVPGELTGIALGISILIVTSFMARSNHRAIAPFWYFLGSVGLLASVFDWVAGVRGLDLLFLPVTLFIMFVSTRMQNRTLLLVSTAFLLGFLIYFTNEYFADVTGWPVALMVMGSMFIAVSAYAVRLAQGMQGKNN